MEELINNMITTLSGLSVQSTIHMILGSHLLPVISNILYTGFIWIAFSIFLYVKIKDRRIITFTLLGLFISAIIGNEIFRPILFHFRETLYFHSWGLYLPEIDKFIFPSGYSMMSMACMVLTYFLARDYFKYGIGIAAIWFFIKLNPISTYPVDFVVGIIIGLLIGFALIKFLWKKEEDEIEIEDLAERFHF